METISRAEAKAKGLKRYFTGKPCKHGHVAERYIAGRCIECYRRVQRALYGQRSPGEGTDGRAIWNALDALVAIGVTPKRSHARQLANKMGWHEGNTVTELNFWRKFHGLTKSRAA
jgi:hypothetical protein